MNQLISTISSFIQTVLATALIGYGVLLFAGEVRLAALKKASQGSSRLSGFTERMTGTTMYKGKDKFRNSDPSNRTYFK